MLQQAHGAGSYVRPTGHFDAHLSELNSVESMLGRGPLVKDRAADRLDRRAS